MEGEIISEGTPKTILTHNTLTADYLSGKRRIEVRKEEKRQWKASSSHECDG